MKKEITYDEVIKTTGAVLIEFYASWCPHCQRMIPVVESVKELLGDHAPVYQFDIDKYEADSDKAGVEIVPTFIIFDNYREVWRHSGEISADELLKAVYSAMERS